MALYSTGPVKLILGGGTNTLYAPFVEYTNLVFARMASWFGVEMTMQTRRRGYFPLGGGEVTAFINPLKTPLKPVELLIPGEVITLG